MARRKTQAENVFELLRSVLGAKVIMVADRRTGQIFWREPPDTTCGYESKAIDSESQQDSDTN